MSTSPSTPRHVYNTTPSLPDRRDKALSLAAYKLPPSKRLSRLTPIKDQGAEGSCTGFALATARASLDRQGPYRDYSPAFIYYEERRLERSVNYDNGANIRDGLKVMLHKGVCLEADFPYRAGDYTTAPPELAEHNAGAYCIAGYARLRTLTGIMHAINQDMPVVLGLAVYESFERTGRDGVVAMPAPNERLLGGHAVKVDGYEETNDFPGGGRLFVPNSWGTAEGDAGYFYLPFAMASNKELVFEQWAIH